MNDLDIPIFKITYELYKDFYLHRRHIAKQDKYTIWQRAETLVLELVEGILWASQLSKKEKGQVLDRVSIKLNLLRVFLRLMKDLKILDTKKYISFEKPVDEIGRMLGGWIKSSKEQ